jgi:hypothetical protein
LLSVFGTTPGVLIKREEIHHAFFAQEFCNNPACGSRCSAHVRVYDPYYHDYHAWDGEVVYYNQWEHDTHRDHVEFNKRNSDDQKAYWDWRHSQH